LSEPKEKISVNEFNESWRLRPDLFAAKFSEGKWKRYDYLKLIGREITEAIFNGGRLIIEMPPRAGKSELISFWSPLWFLSLFPNKKIILASYEAEFAALWGRRVRDMAIENPRLGIEINKEATASSRWETVQGGGMTTAGAGGPITGRGAHCLGEKTLIQTNKGLQTIGDIVNKNIDCNILSYNHLENRAEYKSIEATQKLPFKQFYEIKSESGKRLKCTYDHRVFVLGSGYKETKDLRRGDRIITLPQPEKQNLCKLPEIKKQSRKGLSAMLFRNEKSRFGSNMSSMRKNIYKKILRCGESIPKGAYGILLFFKMLSKTPFFQESKEMLNLRKSGAEKVFKILFKNLQKFYESQKNKAVSAMQNVFSPQKFQNNLLWSGLLQSSTLHPYDGCGELTEFKKSESGGFLDKSTESYSTKRLSKLFDLPNFSRLNSASYRRDSGQQSPRQSDNSMPALSHDAPQIQIDTISSVGPISEREEFVYDIQVEGNHNFFADGILVHNCLIIDDIVKNSEQAASPAYQRRNIEWFKSTFATRGEPGAALIILGTRWNENDLQGWLQSDLDQKGTWKVIRLPAIAEKHDPLGRMPGKALCPERYDERALKKIKKEVGEYYWNSLYQQRPSPLEGGIFKRAWYRHYDELPMDMDEYIQSWDLAFTGNASSAYTVGQIWGRKGANKYLIDQVRKQMDFVETVEAIQLFSATYPEAKAKLVEKAANGEAVLSALKDKISGLIGIKATRSKEDRALSVQPEFEGRNVYFPAIGSKPWLGAFIEEIATFPNSKYKDQTDAMVQALCRLGKRDIANIDFTSFTKKSVAYSLS